MSETRIVKRYNAFYHGWCLAFGEHQALYAEERNINWLFGEDRIGLALSSGIRKRIYRELLGQREQTPTVVLTDNYVQINKLCYSPSDEMERGSMQQLKAFAVSSKELHMFLCNHFVYPPRTRIVTFARKKPLPIMYKEMLPLQLIIE